MEVTPQRDRVAKPYKGRFWSARSYVLHTLADSKSTTMRETRAALHGNRPVPAVRRQRPDGPEALAVTFAGRTIAELNAVPMTELAEIIRPTTELTAAGTASRKQSSGEAQRGGRRHHPGPAAARHRPAGPRPGLPGPGPLHPHALPRRDAAAADRHPAALRAVRRDLRAGRALRRACTRPTPNPCSRSWTSSSPPATRCSWWSTTWTWSAAPTGWWTSGPRAGEGGGEVLYSGPVAGLAEVEASVTRPFLFPDGAPTGSATAEAARRRCATAPRAGGGPPEADGLAGTARTSAGTTCASSTPTSRWAS